MIASGSLTDICVFEPIQVDQHQPDATALLLYTDQVVLIRKFRKNASRFISLALPLIIEWE
jgi:hypothetical protein